MLFLVFIIVAVSLISLLISWVDRVESLRHVYEAEKEAALQDCRAKVSFSCQWVQKEKDGGHIEGFLLEFCCRVWGRGECAFFFFVFEEEGGQKSSSIAFACALFGLRKHCKPVMYLCVLNCNSQLR